jgi:PhzF family phenazine biosynthesis protein
LIAVSIPILQVDAFAEKPFSGNPAGVCLLTSEPSANWMQSLANEMNLAETAFIWPQQDHYGLRWFTPTIEVDLCGHATLASAHVLWEAGQQPKQEAIRFATRSGILTCRWTEEGIEMDFPAEPATAVTPPSDLILALGKYPIWTGKNRMDFLLELKSEEALRELVPDLTAIAQLPARGLIVTAASTMPGIDFVSRFFAPQSGVPEDPVTGSAHCALGPYWSDRLGKTQLVGYQASPRGGRVSVTVEGSRVRLGGKAITVFRGEISPRAMPGHPC